MMRMRMKKPVPKAPMTMSGSAANDGTDSIDWELRPGGMLVQKRDPNADQASVPCPKIKLKVTYGSSLHEVSISMQATFEKGSSIAFDGPGSVGLVELLLLLVSDTKGTMVSALEEVVSSGKKVVESDIAAVIELLMRELVKLDSIMADGDAKLQRRIQVRRVQKYVETLDVLKVRNATQNTLSGHPVVVTTKWETFESSVPPSTSSAKASWELFE